MKQKLWLLAYGIIGIMTGILGPRTLFGQNAQPFDRDIHGYMWANYNQHNGNMQTAHDWYKEIIHNSSSMYSYRGYLHYLYETENYGQIIDVFKKVGTIFANDPDLQLIFVQALRATNNAQKADDLLIQLSDKFKTHMEIAFETAKVYIVRKELENSLHIIDGFLNNMPSKANFFIFHFVKAQVYAQLNEYEKALESIEKTVAMHPNFDKGWLFFAMLHEQKGKLEKAIQGYTHYLQETSDHNNQIEQHLAELVLKSNTVVQNKNTLLISNKSSYEKALLLYEKKQYKLALEQVNNCLEQKKIANLTQVQLLKIQILHVLHQYQEAVNTLLQWVQNSQGVQNSQEASNNQTNKFNQNNVEARQQDNTALLNILHRLALTGAPIGLVVNAFESLHQKQPQNLWPIVYLADLYTRENQQEKALAYYQKAFNITTDKLLKAKVGFQMGLAYYDKQMYESMEQVLHTIIEEAPSFAPVFNLLAYYYATEKKDLVKAQSLITQALTLSPKNPHFLDTQAVIWYKNKQYKKAHDVLTTLAKSAPHDALISIHLAQAQHQLGEASIAVKTVEAVQNYTQTTYEKNKIVALLERWNKQ